MDWYLYPSVDASYNGLSHGPDGMKIWYMNGLKHRENDLPAVEWPNIISQWYTNDNLHREGGLPAVELMNGDKEWYIHGKRHREGGLPAVERTNGIKLWYVDDLLHRKGGLQAVTIPGHNGAWYVNGIYYPEKQVKSVHRIEKWYKRMVQRRFILLVWRVMTPIYFHPNELGGKKAIKALKEYDIKNAYKKAVCNLYCGRKRCHSPK